MTSSNFNKLLMVLLLSCFLRMDLISQVTGVKYILEKQPKSKLIDMYLHIVEGSAKSLKQRVQFGSQISVIVPKELIPKISKTYLPINDHQEYKGTEPCQWVILSKIVSPANDPDCSYYSITPELTPSSFYNNLKKGDKLKLFTLEFTGDPDCIDGVRLFDNNTDPGPSVPGMNGGDFINTFNIGSIKSIYKGNDISKGLIQVSQKGQVLTVNIKGIEYEWFDANDKKSISKSKTPSFKPQKSGDYYVKIKTKTCELRSETIKYTIR